MALLRDSLFIWFFVLFWLHKFVGNTFFLSRTCDSFSSVFIIIIASALCSVSLCAFQKRGGEGNNACFLCRTCLQLIYLTRFQFISPGHVFDLNNRICLLDYFFNTTEMRRKQKINSINIINYTSLQKRNLESCDYKC